GERGRAALGSNSSLPNSKVLPASVEVLDCFAAVLVLDSATASSQRLLEGPIVRNPDRVLNRSIDCAIDNRLSENYPVLDFLVLDSSGVVTELDSSLTAIALEIDFVVTVVVVQSHQSLYRAHATDFLQHLFFTTEQQRLAIDVGISSPARWKQFIDGIFVLCIQCKDSLESIDREVIGVVMNVKPTALIHFRSELVKDLASDFQLTEAILSLQRRAYQLVTAAGIRDDLPVLSCGVIVPLNVAGYPFLRHLLRNVLSTDSCEKLNFYSPESIAIEPHLRSSSSNFFLSLISYENIIMYFTRKIKGFQKFLERFLEIFTEHEKRRD